MKTEGEASLLEEIELPRKLGDAPAHGRLLVEQVADLVQLGFERDRDAGSFSPDLVEVRLRETQEPREHIGGEGRGVAVVAGDDVRTDIAFVVLTLDVVEHSEQPATV